MNQEAISATLGLALAGRRRCRSGCRGCDVSTRCHNCNTSMDLADASLVALAEERHLRDVFTLDRDFGVYRLPDGHAFSLLP